MILGPVEITAAFLRYPLILPDGRKLYSVETTDSWYAANDMPSIRAVDGRPTDLHDELAPGSRVMLALDDQNELRAIKLLDPVWDDPFST